MRPGCGRAPAGVRVVEFRRIAAAARETGRSEQVPAWRCRSAVASPAARPRVSPPPPARLKSRAPRGSAQRSSARGGRTWRSAVPVLDPDLVDAVLVAVQGQQAGVAAPAGGLHRVDHRVRRQRVVGVCCSSSAAMLEGSGSSSRAVLLICANSASPGCSFSSRRERCVMRARSDCSRSAGAAGSDSLTGRAGRRGAPGARSGCSCRPGAHGRR
jgi:hypothetical protein